MKITERQLKQIIKEELEVVLTNEEAAEMFGESVEEQLNEVDMSQAQIIMDAFAQIGLNLSPAVIATLMGYAFKQAVDADKEIHKSFNKRPRGFAKPEDEQLTEVEYGEDGPMYYEPVEGERSPEDAEVLVRGYGGLRIDQIRRKLSSMAEKSSKGDLRELESAIKSGVVPAFLETLKIHSALGPPIG